MVPGRAHRRMKSLPSSETPSQRSPSRRGCCVRMLLKHSRVLGPQKGGSLAHPEDRLMSDAVQKAPHAGILLTPDGVMVV